jgi:hypothetical protein
MDLDFLPHCTITNLTVVIKSGPPLPVDSNNKCRTCLGPDNSFNNKEFFVSASINTE